MRKLRWIFAAGLALGLAACQDSGLDLAAHGGRKIVVGPSVPVAMESLEGLPLAVSARFSAALASEAQAREIAFVDASGQPRFRLRGFLNAYPSDGGTKVAWVWDVFDARQQRARRVDGVEVLRRADTDPWNAVDDAVLRRIAARSLDEVGGFLVDRSADAPMASASPARKTGAATLASAAR